MKAYLLVFSTEFGLRNDVVAHIDTWPEIPFWHTSLPQCIFLTSDLSANEIAARLEKHFVPTSGRRFLVVEVSSNSQGRLPDQSWHMINNPDDPRLPEKSP